MSLSNISKEHIDNLFLSLSENNLNELEKIKRNHVSYGKLKLIAKQILSLKNEALEIIEESNIQDDLQSIGTNFKVVSGNYYYLYKKNDKKYFSLIAPDQWNNNDVYLGKYLYDYDKNFVKQ